VHNWKLLLGLLLVVGGLFAFIHPYYNVVLWTFFFGFSFILWFAYDKRKSSIEENQVQDEVESKGK